MVKATEGMGKGHSRQREDHMQRLSSSVPSSPWYPRF